MSKQDMIFHVARKMNKTPQEVELELRRTIQEAMQSTDPEAQRIWKEIAPDGKEPPIEKVIEYCVRYLKQQQAT